MTLSKRLSSKSPGRCAVSVVAQTDAVGLQSCIVVSGLASHAYGSWKSRNGDFMWLRDDATWRKPNVRVLLYGYDTTLVSSESFQTIENIGAELGGALSRIRSICQVSEFP